VEAAQIFYTQRGCPHLKMEKKHDSMAQYPGENDIQGRRRVADADQQMYEIWLSDPKNKADLMLTVI